MREQGGAPSVLVEKACCKYHSSNPSAGTSVLGEQEAGVAKGKRTTHKEELDALKEKDPDFHKYLQQTDQELLNFEDGEEEEEEEEDDDKEEQVGSWRLM